jgi:aldehyde dehydrogenase (NAD+)
MLITKGKSATEAFKTFRTMAPQRGEIVRQFGEKLRKNKSLGKLVSYEMEITTRRIRRSSE